MLYEIPYSMYILVSCCQGNIAPLPVPPVPPPDMVNTTPLKLRLAVPKYDAAHPHAYSIIQNIIIFTPL